MPLSDTGLVLNSSARIGAVHRLSGEKRVRVVDRFFVGGPGSMRGFRRRGVGDHDERDPLGSDFFTTAFLGLSFPVGSSGLLGSLGFDTKAHVWGTAGDVCSLRQVSEKVKLPRFIHHQQHTHNSSFPGRGEKKRSRPVVL